jgi:hypothetical protein
MTSKLLNPQILTPVFGYIKKKTLPLQRFLRNINIKNVCIYT